MSKWNFFACGLPLTSPRDEDLGNWMHYIQAEGQPYFCNASASRDICYVTEENLFVEKTRLEVEAFVEEFERKVGAFRLGMSEEDKRLFPDRIEVAVEVTDHRWKYYMVDLEKRVVFWIDHWEKEEEVLGPYFGVEYLEHFSEFEHSYPFAQN